MKIQGIVTLNIDGLASRSYAQQRKGKINEFEGTNCGPWIRTLKATTPFIINLHGTSDNSETWVFRSNDISELQARPDYRTLISNLFGSKTIVFIGISAHDRAAGGLLEAVTKQGIDLGTHFWITSDRGVDTDEWAENAGLRVIRYEAESDDEHTQCLRVILNELKRYTPRDSDAAVSNG